MDVPSMVQRSGNKLIVRSVVSGNQLYFQKENNMNSDKGINSQQENVEISSDFSLDESLRNPTNKYVNEELQTLNEKKKDDEKDEELPQCKIKRNYSCNSCTFFTQNPRHFLTHLRDEHGEKIVINECKLCLYASRHYQKLVRHMKMVHGSTDGIEENGSARKRQLNRETKKKKVDNQSTFLQMLSRNKSNEKQILDIKKQINSLPSKLDAEKTNFNKRQKFETEMSKTQIFKCSLCDFSTLYRFQLAHHESNEHCTSSFFRCEKCSYVTHIKARFSKHVKYHSMPMIKCITCDFRTPYKWNLDRHMKNHGGAGAFKCTACNFTADIKQSLTVHEMNHHIPPVGHASGTVNMRKRNKVGGTDNSNDMLNDLCDLIEDSNSNNASSFNIEKKNNNFNSNEAKYKNCFNNDDNNNLEIDSKKIEKIKENSLINETEKKNCPDDRSDQENLMNNIKKSKYFYGEELPTDLSKNFKQNEFKKKIKSSDKFKANRPIPKLIPIQTGTLSSTTNKFSDSNILRDDFFNLNQIVKVLFGKEIPQELIQNFPEISPTSDSSGSMKRSIASNYDEQTDSKTLENYSCSIHFEENNEIIEKKQKLNCEDDKIHLYDDFSTNDSFNCNEKFTKKTKSNKSHSTLTPVNLSVNIRNMGSLRCKNCRQHCKSMEDLLNHIKLCNEKDSSENDVFETLRNTIKQNPYQCENDENLDSDKKHPMENKVFIWNNISDQSQCMKNLQLEDISIPSKENFLQSEASRIETDFSCNEEKSDEISYYGVETAPGYGEVTRKAISEEDAANASLKKVYKCPHCSFWASTASRFHVHIVGHLNKKPFECSLCNYRSNWRWDITKHIRLKTIRDPSHKSARVLMNDETGRRNYTKYNKFITLMKVTDEDGDPKLMKSGEMTPNQEASLSFLKDYDNKIQHGLKPLSNLASDKLNNSFITTCTSTYEKKQSTSLNASSTVPKLNDSMLSSNIFEVQTNKGSDSIKSTSFKFDNTEDPRFEVIECGNEKNNEMHRCKECNYTQNNRDNINEHVKQHSKICIKNDQNQYTPKLSTDQNNEIEPKIESNCTTFMNNMLALFINQQGGVSFSDQSYQDEVFHYMKNYTALNLDFDAAGKLKTEKSSSRKDEDKLKESENGEIDEASSVEVITTSTNTPTSSISLTSNSTCTNHIYKLKSSYICNNENYAIKKLNTTNAFSAIVIGNSNSGSSNTSLSGGIFSSNFNNLNTKTHSAIEQNVTHKIINNIKTRSYNMGNNGGHLHNKTDQWRGPAPYRCGHCHQVSNWKHVIQRHCRLKHNGDIQIETIDRSSEILTPLYRPLGHHIETKLSQYAQNNQLTIPRKNNQNEDINNESSKLTKTFIIGIKDVTDENNRQTNSTIDEPSNPILSKSKQQYCPQCPYVSESKSQMNYHISLHKAKQYECTVCGLLFNKKQQLFAHIKQTHDSEQHVKNENNLALSINSLNDKVIHKTEMSIENNTNENFLEDNVIVIRHPTDSNGSFNSNKKILFCQDCPMRFWNQKEFDNHSKFHQSLENKNEPNFKCDLCSFNVKQENSLFTHFAVHRQDYQDRTETLLQKFAEDERYPRANLQNIHGYWQVITQHVSQYKEKIHAVSLETKFPNNYQMSVEKYSETEKCSYCPFKTGSNKTYKEHLKCHYIVSKIKWQFSCSHCDFSCGTEFDLKIHLKYHFSFFNNENSVAFFTSYNNLELKLVKNNTFEELNERYENLSPIILYKSFDINVNNLEKKHTDLNNDQGQFDVMRSKDVIDFETGQILPVSTKLI